MPAKVLYITNYQREETEFLSALRPKFTRKFPYLWAKYCVPVLNAMDYLSKRMTMRKLNIYSHLQVVK